MYARRLYAYSLQFTKSPEESEEIVQDVFVKLWTNRQAIRQEDTLRSLLFIMTKHQLINAFRARVNQPVYEEYVEYREVMAESDPQLLLEYQDFLKRFKTAMKALPETQQKVITLSKLWQLSNKEIAEKLSLSEQTVKNQLSIGLKMLRQELVGASPLCILLFVNLIDF